MRFWTGVFILVCAAGCMSSSKSEQFTDFAKDWSKAIRAQQVIPIYPLVENLQVGDVFLVDRPIENEAEQYDAEGYLPLGRFISSISDTLPSKDPWPKAAFATFSFDLRRGGSVGAGIPVQGVPVSFSLLGAESATATVSLKDATVYHLPDDKLEGAVNQWSEKMRSTLAMYRPAYERNADGTFQMRYSYVRIITGVFRIKKATVVLNDATSLGGKGRVGIAENLGLITAGATPPADATSLTETINKALAPASQPAAKDASNGTTNNGAPTTSEAAPPAAGVEFSAYGVTSSGLSLDETFDTPLAVGYVAIDYPIGYEGKLGSHPTETRQRLSHGGSMHTRHLVSDFIDENPRGPELVRAWYDLNQKWVEEQLGPTTFEELLVKLHRPWFVFWDPIVPSMKRVSLRILSEVVERPEGLPELNAKELSDVPTRTSTY